MTSHKDTRGIVTCDLEGRIQTFNAGAEEILGYQAGDVIGKKRLSLILPGLSLLGQITRWFKVARQRGEYGGTTVLTDREGRLIPASITITPTFNNGQHSGYCGTTELLENVSPEYVAPKISMMTRLYAWVVITRAPFLSAIIIPILIASAWVSHSEEAIQLPNLTFWIVLTAAMCLHIAANTFNDYFDWRSGSDKLNNDYFSPYSGGSRAIELGLISEHGLWRLACVVLMVAVVLGVVLTVVSGPGILLFGLIGAFSAYFYTAPPLRLIARRGLGELTVGLNFGPLAVAGAVYALTGQFSPQALLVGIPVGLLTTAILWINQFPDEAADRISGKTNLVVVLGKARARWGYLVLLAGAIGFLLIAMLAGALPAGAMLALIALPLGIRASYAVIREYAERSLIRANAATIQLHFLFGVMLTTGIAFNQEITDLLG